MVAKVHLLVLIHGLWGHPRNLTELERVAKERHGESNAEGVELEVLMASKNKSASTYDGVDWGGERIADEVLAKIAELEEDNQKQVVSISITGYSLGGLVARYMIGIFHQRKIFERIQPIDFCTFSTPHLGCLKYPSFGSTVMAMVGTKLLSRTGVQLFCLDKWSPNGRPLLEVMADPDRIFFQALERFKYVRLYANGVNDAMVPYSTAAIDIKDPFVEYRCNGIRVTMYKGYEHVISSFTLPDTPPPKPPLLSSKWFETVKPRPLLPPSVTYPFPFNIFLYTLLPLLIPVIASYAFIRILIDGCSSKARVKSLQEDASYREKLAAILAELETQLESSTYEETSPDGSDLIEPPHPIIRADLYPVVTPRQRKMAAWLNRLPWRKEVAFFPNVRNSHGMIVCRDVNWAREHRRGESVIRHWADNFVL